MSDSGQAKVRYSKLARLDLIEIADYTVDLWGLEQADRYISELERCIQQVARTPGIGKPCERIRQGYRTVEQGKHIVFYRAEKGSIFVSRILHQRMLPSRHMIEDE